jgi:hypothetical protein
MPGYAGCRLPLPGADSADDDAKLVGATATSQRQVDQWHVAVSAGHQGLEIKPDSMLTGATPGRHVIAMRDGSRRRQSIRHPGPLPHFARSSHARIRAAASSSSGRRSARRSFPRLRLVVVTIAAFAAGGAGRGAVSSMAGGGVAGGSVFWLLADRAATIAGTWSATASRFRGGGL